MWYLGHRCTDLQVWIQFWIYVTFLICILTQYLIYGVCWSWQYFHHSSVNILSPSKQFFIFLVPENKKAELAFAWKFIIVNWIRVSVFKIINIVDWIFKTFFWLVCGPVTGRAWYSKRPLPSFWWKQVGGRPLHADLITAFVYNLDEEKCAGLPENISHI